MYEAFFGLSQEPFSISPDPRFLFLTDKHRQALSLLEHGLGRGTGFVLLTGEIGAGKTTVWRAFLESLPSNFDVASVVNPRLDVGALLSRVCEDLRVELPDTGGAVDLIDALHGHLLLAHAQGRRTLIVIDEAQALSAAVLEQLRLLTNLDSTGRLLHVMLIGQPELRTALESPQLEPLAQRIVARYHLPALSAGETARYIEHRMKIAGMSGALPFDGEALAAIHSLCGGIPRRINVLCDHALTAAYTQGLHRVDTLIVTQAQAEAFGRSAAVPPVPAPRSTAPTGWVLAGLAVVAAVALGSWLRPGPTGAAAPAGAVPAAAAGLASAPAPAAVAPTVVTAVAAAAAGASSPASAAALSAAASAPDDRPVAPSLAAAAAAAPTAPVPGLERVFGSRALPGEAMAWRTLAGRWGVTLGSGDPCTTAPAFSLYCFRSHGGLAPIRQLDRPGIVKLVDDRGRIAFVLLTALKGDLATLSVNGGDIELPLTQLAQFWRGEFATLWRAPPGYREGELPGSGGPLGRWLAMHLAAIDGAGGLPAASDDASLHERIFAFQLAHGLAPDGLAGPQTLIQLNHASGVDEPHLLTAR